MAFAEGVYAVGLERSLIQPYVRVSNDMTQLRNDGYS
jgi:hypothetical protein